MNTLAKHTPGPWTWDGYSLRPANPDPDQHAVHTIIDAEHIGWGFVCSDLRITTAESNANLALIAAAPELLTALEALCGLAEFRGGHLNEYGAAVAAARAVIAKAKVPVQEAA